MSNHGRLTKSWWAGATPPTQVILSAGTYVGVAFSVDTPGRIYGFGLYYLANTADNHVAVLWDPADTSDKHIRGLRWQNQPAGNGWQNVWIHPTFRPVVNHTYYVAILTFAAYYRSNTSLGAGVISNHVKYLNGFQSTSIMPPKTTPTLNTNRNGIDVLFEPDSA